MEALALLWTHSTDCIRLLFAFDYTPFYAFVIDIRFLASYIASTIDNRVRHKSQANTFGEMILPLITLIIT